MKKVFLLAFAAIFSTVLFAQTTPSTQTPAATDKKKDMKDLRHDIRDKRQDERQRAKDKADGNTPAAKSLTKDIKSDKKDIKADAKDAKEDGVKHPVKRADRQIHRRNVRH